MPLADLAVLPLSEGHLGPSRTAYNHYILHSTANFHEEPLSEEEFRKMLAFSQPGHGACAAMEGNAFLGFGYVGPYKSRCAYRFTAEVTIYLAPERIRHGVGTAILAALEETARKGGIRTLIAGICLENEPSVRFFEKHGYERCAHFKKVGYKFGRYLDTVYAQKFLNADRPLPCSASGA